MIKGYKIRIYPTREQQDLIWKHFGASRFIWNYMLNMQEENHANGGKFISAFGMHHLLTPLKKQEGFEWLTKISNGTLQCICADLAEAYKHFFGGAGFPKYKSRKKAKPAYPIRCDEFYVLKGHAQIPKLGRVKYKSDFQFPEGRGHKFSDVRLSYKNGKYMLSFGIECENQAPELHDYSMGIDLGIKDLAVVACGDDHIVFHNINKSKKIRDLKKKIRHVQRSISRKYEASKKRNGGRYEKTANIIKEEDKLSRLYARLSNIRENYIHQTTHELVSMLPREVIMEELNVMGMMKNRHLGKAVAEQCFYEFARQMQYKCEWNGIPFTKVPRFYPSSKTCSCCGEIKHDLKLSDRTYVCPKCGLEIDRDYNAAINLMRYTDSQTGVVA